MQNIIIALWSHPRSLSTAMERVFTERGDFKVLHEPFSYLYYVIEKRGTAIYENEDRNTPKTYQAVKENIVSFAEKSPVFFKDMCYHCHDHLIGDEAFLNKIHNTFIIRDPSESIASHYAINPRVTLEEIGYEHQFNIFQKLVDMKCKAPIVIEAGDLKDDPKGIVEAYCDALKIEFLPRSMHWEKGHRKVWHSWEKWHTDVSQSTGIHIRGKNYTVTVENNSRLRSYYEYHIPFYEEMYQYKL